MVEIFRQGFKWGDTAPKFDIGKVFITNEAYGKLEREEFTVMPILARHERGDYGTAPVPQVEANDDAIAGGGYIVSHYTTAKATKIYIYTELTHGKPIITTISLSREL